MANLRRAFAGQHFPPAHISLGRFGAPLPMTRQARAPIDLKMLDLRATSRILQFA